MKYSILEDEKRIYLEKYIKHVNKRFARTKERKLAVFAHKTFIHRNLSDELQCGLSWCWVEGGG